MSELIREIKWGNIIGSKTNPDGWRIYASDFEFIMDFPDDYFPIPLSTEWLERLGFEQYNEGFWRIGNSEGWFLTSDGELVKSLSEFYIRCESVHQLQNLIYSLTGKELELKQ